MRAVRRGLTGIRWYLREVTGESRYEKYLASRGDHAGRGALTEREFWRERSRRLEENPPSRCC